MSTTATLEQTTGLNSNGATEMGNPAIHQLGISKDELIPRNCKNCHCLQTGLQTNRLILIGETDDAKQWIICTPSETRNILHATVHLQIYGISEDRGETATSLKIVEKRGCKSLFDLLNEMKGSDLTLERVEDDSGKLLAFYLS